MSIHILFKDLSQNPDPRGYMTRKLTDFFRTSGATTACIEDLVDRVYAPGTAFELPLAEEKDLPRFSLAQRRLLDEKLNLFRAKVESLSPLLQGETCLLDSDRCTVLRSSFGEYKAGTPVLIRKTNLATVCYLYHLASLSPSGEFTYHPDSPVPHGTLPSHTHPVVGVGLWADLLLEIGEGLLGAIGEKIGNELLAAIFPDDKGIDYQQMLTDFSAIVYGANTDQTISEQAGITNGILSDNIDYYLPRKRSGAGKTELYTQLLEYHNKLAGVIGTLQYKDAKIDYTKKGLPVCILAMDTHLAIYQEMALEDPNVQDPIQSSNVESIRVAAPKFAAYVDGKVNEIVGDNVQARLSKITDVMNNPWCDGTNTGVVCKSRYFFVDNETGYNSGYYEQHGCTDDPEARCRNARNAYVEQIRAQVTPQKVAELQWALDTSTQWKQLPKNPLPNVADRALCLEAR